MSTKQDMIIDALRDRVRQLNVLLERAEWVTFNDDPVERCPICEGPRRALSGEGHTPKCDLADALWEAKHGAI